MKKTATILAVMAVVFALFSAVMIAIAPDTVPLHYNFAGEVDKMGSKWELLVYPGIMAAMALIFAVTMPKAQKEQGNERVMGILLPVTFGVMALILGYFMIKAAVYDPQTAIRWTGETLRIVFVLLGILIAVLGNFMPKARKNHLFGLRTPWAYKNDEVWRKSQRVSGMMAVVCGVVTVILALVLPLNRVAAVCSILLIAMSFVGIGVSWYFARQQRSE